MNYKLLIATLILITSFTAEAANPAKKIFNTISKLAGEWKGTYSNGNQHRVSYQLISNGTVLVETWTMSPTRVSMTIYSVDGDRLIATHYCPQGNQPRLTFMEKTSDNRLQFRFLDGTNLQDPNGSHQHAFWLSIESPESFTRSETYISNVKTTLLNVEEGEPVTYFRTALAK